MKLHIISLFIIITSISNSMIDGLHYFELEDSSIIIMQRKGSILINQSCEKKDCEALEVLKTKVPVKLVNAPNGKNPGAVVCTKYLGGKILMLKERKTSSIQSFCLFKDGSILSNTTIYSDIMY